MWENTPVSIRRIKSIAAGLVMKLTVMGLAMILSSTLALAQEVRVSQFANGRPGEIEINLVKSGKQAGVLELLSDNGKVVKTLAAGRLGHGKNMLRIAPDVEAPAGSYTLRYREGLSLKQEALVTRPGATDGKWTNPTDIRLQNNKLYIFDAGLDTNDETQKQTAIIRLNLDGTPDTTFGTDAIAPIGYRGGHVTAMSIDPDGQLYISNGYHSTEVFDPQGKSTRRYIAGWNNEPYGPLATGWINSQAIGNNNKIYFPTGYGNIKVYDRTKNNFEGALYFSPLPGNLSTGRAIAADNNRLYIVNQHHQIERYNDTGKEVKSQYATDTEDRVAFPAGIHIVDQLLWTCATGPGWGPYWDSQGGGEIVLYHDDGTSLKIVDRFGFPGNLPDRLEFMHPSAVVTDAKNQTLWVVENGLTAKPAPEGSPPGNAQVRKFNITADKTIEVKITLKKPGAPADQK